MVVVLIIMTITQNALYRFDMTTKDIQEWQFGGHSQAVYFNTLVPTTKTDFDPNSALDSFSPGLSEVSCNVLMSVISKYSENQVNFAYKEFFGKCSASDWGFKLNAGNIPRSNNEVAVTEDTGYAIGDTITGLTPKPLLVVGSISNSNKDNARVIVAFSGTFRSFGWPETLAKWPNLTALVVSTFDGQDQLELESYFRNLDSNVAFDYLSNPRRPLVDKFPYLYSWTAFPLFAVSIIFSLALRNVYTRRRVNLLNSQGVSESKSKLVMLLANTMHLLVFGIFAVIAGSLIALTLSEPIRLMSSRELGPFPLPLDPLFKYLLALFTIFVVVLGQPTGSKIFSSIKEKSRNSKFSKRSSVLVSAALFIAALASLNSPLFQLSYFAFVLLTTVGIAFISNQLLGWLVPKRKSRDLGIELAKRRVLRSGLSSGLAFTGSILAIAPVLTFLLMFSSALAESNKSAVLLPGVDQVTHDIFQPSENDEIIRKLSLQAAGDGGSANYYYSLQTDDGTPVVASPDRLGAVIVVDSVAALEVMLQESVKVSSASVLNQGGILWFSSDSKTSLWTLSLNQKPAQEVKFSDSALQKVPLVWSNQAKAVILDNALSERGLSKGQATLVIGGISEDESKNLADNLLAHGLDPSLVHFHKSGDAYSETPLQLGITGIMALLALALLASSTRSMVSSLKSQTRELISLGVPNSWMTRVFLQEFRSTIGLGALAGLLLTALATGLALFKFNLAAAIPWGFLISYAFTLLFALTLIIWLSLRRLRT